MNLRKLFKRVGTALLICLPVLLSTSVDAAFLYKSYLVKSDRGREILCDPYIVQKDDYVLKLMRQKGEIAAEDFPEFLAIFRRINPHIRDVNLIRPGQQIFIPLRVLRSNEMPGQASGVVTIPYVTISGKQERILGQQDRYLVREGDCVSKIIAGRFGRYGSDAYWEGIRLFRMMNPNVADLNLIYAGQVLRLPSPGSQNAPPPASAIEKTGTPSPLSPSDTAGPGPQALEKAGAPAEPQSPLAAAAAAVGAELLENGSYYFPRPGRKDFRLDLSRVPAMKFTDGSMVLLPEIDSLGIVELEGLDPLPERTDTVPVSPGWDAQRIVQEVMAKTGRARSTDRLVVSDNGLRMEIHARWIMGKTIDATGEIGRVCILPLKDCRQRIPDSITGYLQDHDVLIREICKEGEQSVRHPVTPRRFDLVRIESADRRSFVREVLTSLGCEYSPNVSISFPYAGVHVRAQTNLAAFPDGREFLVDFGDLYGDAISAVEKTGFSVVRIVQRDRREILVALLKALGRPFRQDPTLWAAKREGPYNVAVTFRGFLLNDENDRHVLLSEAILDHRILDFLDSRGIRVVQVGFRDVKSAS